VILHLGVAELLPALLKHPVTEGGQQVRVLVLAHVLRKGGREGRRDGGRMNGSRAKEARLKNKEGRKDEGRGRREGRREGGKTYLVHKLDEGLLERLVEEGILFELGVHHAHALVVQGQEGLGGRKEGREGGRAE